MILTYEPAQYIDACGNPIRIVDPDGYALGFEYDAMDRWLTAADKAGNSVVRSLDISGRVRAKVFKTLCKHSSHHIGYFHETRRRNSGGYLDCWPNKRL